jgi:hypothetical protein
MRVLGTANVEANPIIASGGRATERQKPGVHQFTGENLVRKKLLKPILLTFNIAVDANASDIEGDKNMALDKLSKHSRILDPRGECMASTVHTIHERTERPGESHQTIELRDGIHMFLYGQHNRMHRMVSGDIVVRSHPVILSALSRKSPVHRTKRGGDVLVAVPDPRPHTTALRLQTGARSPGSLHLACYAFP